MKYKKYFGYRNKKMNRTRFLWDAKKEKNRCGRGFIPKKLQRNEYKIFKIY